MNKEGIKVGSLVLPTRANLTSLGVGIVVNFEIGFLDKTMIDDTRYTIYWTGWGRIDYWWYDFDLELIP